MKSKPYYVYTVLREYINYIPGFAHGMLMNDEFRNVFRKKWFNTLTEENSKYIEEDDRDAFLTCINNYYVTFQDLIRHNLEELQAIRKESRHKDCQDFSEMMFDFVFQQVLRYDAFIHEEIPELSEKHFKYSLWQTSRKATYEVSSFPTVEIFVINLYESAKKDSQSRTIFNDLMQKIYECIELVDKDTVFAEGTRNWHKFFVKSEREIKKNWQEFVKESMQELQADHANIFGDS